MALYLVTGVAGFIGSSIARALIDRGDRVRGVDSLITGKRENLAGLETLDFIEGNIADAAVSAEACAGVDYIFHEAALPSVPRSVEDPIETNECNVTATLQLLVAARNAKVKRVVYAGSSSAYGDAPTQPKREDMTPGPLSPYAVSKLTGEHYMRAFTQVYGLESVTLRYFNVFGPRQDPSSMYSGVLARFITQMLRGQRPTILGDGEQSRDFTYIDNVVSGNLLACAAPAELVSGKMFNVAAGARITLNETYSILQGLTAFSGPVNYGPEREGDIKHSQADIALAQQSFSYKVLVNFRDGLERTVEWYKKTTGGKLAIA